MKNYIKFFLVSLITIFIILGSAYFIFRNPNKVSNIVFTSDKAYKEYLKVALLSAIENKKPESIYKINIICVDLSKKEMEEYKKFETENVSIEPIYVDLASINHIGDFNVANHVSRADLFKFMMPYIFKDLDRILYIDADTLILGDLTKLYNTNMGNKCLGAVLKYTHAYHWEKVYNLFWIRHEVLNYNCGVMLYDLKKMRENNITEKLIESKNSDRQRVLMTQTAYNEVIPVKDIYRLSPMYNAVARWRTKAFKTYEFKKKYFPYLIGINSLDELFNKAVIIHYAGKAKPWFSQDVRFGQVWWFYAKKINPNWKLETPIYNERGEFLGAK